jgi:hypothetical protein
MTELRTPLKMEIQEENQWCWAAVAAAIHNRKAGRAKALTQCQIAGKVKTQSDVHFACSNPAPFNEPESLEKALRTIGHLHNAGIGTAPFDEIEKEIAADRPICARIVWDRNGDRLIEGAHFVVIVGCGVVAKVPHVIVDDPHGFRFNGPLEVFSHQYRSYGVWLATYFVNG